MGRASDDVPGSDTGPLCWPTWTNLCCLVHCSKLPGYVTPEAHTPWRPSLLTRRFPLRWQAHSERRTHLKKVLQDTKAKGDDIARRMQPLVAQLGDTIKHLDQVLPAAPGHQKPTSNRDGL
jgi:hypothetical protein